MVYVHCNKTNDFFGKYKVFYTLLVILTLCKSCLWRIFFCLSFAFFLLQGFYIFLWNKMYQVFPFHFWPLTHDKKDCHFSWIIKIFILFSPITFTVPIFTFKLLIPLEFNSVWRMRLGSSSIYFFQMAS